MEQHPSSAPAPPPGSGAPAPLPSVPPAPRKPLFRWRDIVGLGILLLVVFPLLLYSCRLVSHSSDEGRQSDLASRASGINEVSAIPWTVDGDILYPLAAVRPADDWANGAQRAWSVGLSAASGIGSTGKRYAANGNVMVALDGAGTWQNTVRGWDISGGAPRELWSYTVPSADTPHVGLEPRSVWVGDTLFVGHYAINGRTGQTVSLSWLRQDGSGRGDKDLIVTTGPLLVACDPGTGGCTGHSADGNVMWEASTGVRDYAMRGSAASGGDEWIWLDGLGEPGVFLNTATGGVKRAERRATGKCWSTGAVDGWLVACEGDSQIAAFAADGTAVGAFGAARWPVSTRGEGECSDAGVPVWQGTPTLDEATAYYRDGDESRVLGVLTATDCGYVEYRTPGGLTAIIDISGDDPDLWQFVLGEFGQPSTGVGQWFHFAISDGGRILAVGNTVLIDVGSGEHMGLPRVADSPDQLPLKAPGLVLSVDGGGVVAIAPGR